MAPAGSLRGTGRRHFRWSHPADGFGGGRAKAPYISRCSEAELESSLQGLDAPAEAASPDVGQPIPRGGAQRPPLLRWPCGARPHQGLTGAAVHATKVPRTSIRGSSRRARRRVRVIYRFGRNAILSTSVNLTIRFETFSRMPSTTTWESFNSCGLVMPIDL